MLIEIRNSDDRVSKYDVVIRDRNSDNMETLLYCLINCYVYEISCSSSCFLSIFILDGWESSKL